jgi:hypothetical protein
VVKRRGPRIYSFGMPTVRTRVKPLPLAATALGLALASGLGACSSAGHDPAANGPLSSGTGKSGKILPHDGECATRFYGRRWAFGIDQFTNYGGTTVVLDRVVLLRPHNERLIGADVIPGTREPVGAITWPPNWPSVRGAWKTRQPVRGFRVAPRKTFSMVLGVEPTDERNATADGMLVYYHDPAGSYVAPSYLATQIAIGKDGC